MTGLNFGSLGGKRVVLGVTGSIAAFKAPMILRELRAAGAEVKVILTESAEKFIGAPVFSGLGGEVYKDIWAGPGEPHVTLASWADVILVAPATAETMAKMRMGRAHDILTATILCFSGPVMVAPAMHPRMWAHPATQENVAQLKQRGVQFIGPAFGQVASGDEGIGRMEEPDTIAQALVRSVSRKSGTLKGRHIVITAGPTREAIDPVRSITNISSGKMGYALAAAALARGAEVTLISGPVALTPPTGAHLVAVESATELQAALDQCLGDDLSGADVLVMAAAVSDYRPETPSTEKLKRTKDPLTLRLAPNPDVLRGIGQKRQSLRPILVGFALETVSDNELVQVARRKLIDKRVDLIVANHASDSLGRDDNRVQLVAAQDCTPLPVLEKPQVAGKILDWIERRLAAPPSNETIS